jgi:predicted phage tail protein
VGGGVVFVLGQADFAAFSDGKANDSLTAGELRALHGSGSLKSVIGAVGLGVGGAFVLGGITIAMLAPKATPSKTNQQPTKTNKKQLFFVPPSY